MKVQLNTQRGSHKMNKSATLQEEINKASAPTCRLGFSYISIYGHVSECEVNICAFLATSCWLLVFISPDDGGSSNQSPSS